MHAERHANMQVMSGQSKDVKNEKAVQGV